jgi:hypothetical protein
VIGCREGSHLRGHRICPLLEQHPQILVPRPPATRTASDESSPIRPGAALTRFRGPSPLMRFGSEP